jgi:hypothetical protein
MRTANRRSAAIVGLGLVVLGAGGLVHAQGGITITPSSGPPGTAYEVRVACGVAPEVKRADTQDGPLQGTIAPYPPDQLVEVSPSVWAVDGEATSTDDAWFATCEGAEVGTARFDAESPHLWFGPRPRPFPGPGFQYTTLEGTDCPAGSTATAQIQIADDVAVLESAVDELGDWSVELPAPLGQAEMTIRASCGDLAYDVLQVTTTTTSTTSPSTPFSTPTSAPGGSGSPTPATPVRGVAGYTG